MPFLGRLVEACSTAPDGAGIIEGDSTLPYGEMLRRSVGLSLLLRSHDKSTSGNIGIILPNISAFPISYFAAQMAGKVAVPINVLLQPAEIAFILKDAEIHTVLTISMFKPLIDGVSGALPWEVQAFYLDQPPEEAVGLIPPPVEQLIAHEEPDKLACLIYTSGTTGNPKGVELTYGNLEANFEGSARVLELKKHRDVMIAQLPLFHSFGMMATMICPILEQSPLVMLARFQPTTLLKTISERKVTALLLVAPMYGLLCRHPRIRETDLSALRICVSGGGPLPPNIEQGWKALTGKEILNGYGLTEASPVVANNAPRAYREASIGRPLHNVEVEIRDANNQAVPVGEEGEICVRAASVMKGYHKRPDETKETFTPDGLLRTGDLGRLDEDGFLYITGRAKDLIIFAGENIMPLEIENMLATHPAVAEAAVVGLPDPSKGEVPIAAVTLLEGKTATSDELREHLKGKIADFKIPRECRIVEELPKNTMNKVLKPKLREMLMAD